MPQGGVHDAMSKGILTKKDERDKIPIKTMFGNEELVGHKTGFGGLGDESEGEAVTKGKLWLWQRGFATGSSLPRAPKGQCTSKTPLKEVETLPT